MTLPTLALASLVAGGTPLEENEARFAAAGTSTGLAAEPADGHVSAWSDASHAPSRPEVAPFPHYRFAVKTNLLSDIIGTVSLGLEFPLCKRFSLGLDAAYSNWQINNLYAFQNVMTGIGAKYWFNPRHGALTGWNAGIYGLYCSRYDAQWKDGVQGDGLWSTGISAGYALRLGGRFNMEFAAAGGYIRVREARSYDRPENGRLMWSKTRYGVSRFGPTKLQVNLMWILGGK